MSSAAWSSADDDVAPGEAFPRDAGPPLERPGRVRIENGTGVVRISLTGAVDAVLAPRLDGVVADVIAAQPADVRLDLGQVDFLGSHGMAFLVRVQHAARTAGRAAAIDGVSRQALVALRIAGLESYVRV